MSTNSPAKRQLSRREVLRLMGAASGLAVLAGCAPATAPVGAPAAGPAADATTITMWTHDNLYVQFFTRRGDQWKDNYPDREIVFDFQQVPYNEVFTKVLANLAAGSGAPDLVGIEIGAFSRFMKGDIAEKGLVPFNDLIGDERDKFLRWAPYTHNGNLYGVESALCPVGYWYQPALFEEAGIELPLATWDDFVVAGNQLKEATGASMAPVDDLGSGLFMQLFQQRGQKLFSEEGEVTLNTPEAVDLLQFLVNGAEGDRVFFKAGADSYWGPATYAAYKDGVVAGAIMPDWYLTATLKSELADMEGQWRLTTLPLWADGGHRTSTWGGTGFGITTHSTDIQLVWDLLHYTYLTREGQVERFQQIGYFPHMIEAFDDPGVADVEDAYCGGQKVGAVFASVAEDIPLQWQNAFWSEAMTELGNHLTLAYAGDMGPEEAIEAADETIKAIVARGDA
jgi:ABC-type glycerol-3-phosphate transport system substrate-binding protein